MQKSGGKSENSGGKSKNSGGKFKSDDEAEKKEDRGRLSGKRSGHKHFRRSRASVNVDDAIEEEDEEAVEAENIEVVFTEAPPFKVRSILKPSTEEEEGEMGATASTAGLADSAALSPELFLGEPRERPKPKASRPKVKKSVAFADSPVVLPECPNAFSPLSLTSTSSSASSASSGGSDDEWSGYDKVVVSHNLAEEILDEIYGKLEDNEEKGPLIYDIHNVSELDSLKFVLISDRHMFGSCSLGVCVSAVSCLFKP